MSDPIKTIEAQAALAGYELRQTFCLTSRNTTMWFPDLGSVQTALELLAESPYVTSPLVPFTCPSLKK